MPLKNKVVWAILPVPTSTHQTNSVFMLIFLIAQRWPEFSDVLGKRIDISWCTEAAWFFKAADGNSFQNVGAYERFEQQPKVIAGNLGISGLEAPEDLREVQEGLQQEETAFLLRIELVG